MSNDPTKRVALERGGDGTKAPRLDVAAIRARVDSARATMFADSKRLVYIAEVDAPALLDALNAAAQREAKLVALLQTLQWSGRDDIGGRVCPECLEEPKLGHFADCKLAEALEAKE